MEIHSYSKSIEYYRRRMESLQSKNSSTGLKFLDALLVYGTGKGRVASYAGFAFRIIELAKQSSMLSDKTIADWKKEDVDLLARSVIEKNCSGTTKHLFLLTMKRLVHFAKHGVIMEKKDGIDYCEEVKHLSPSRFRKQDEKVEKIKPQDLLTVDEFLQLIDAIPKVSANVKRDTAALYVAKEYAGRPGEVLNMTVSGVEFNDAYCTVTTGGKTGQKTLTLVLSYKPLLEWLQHHPKRDNPDAYLFYADNQFGKITYTYLQRLLKRCAKEAGIKKRVWLYLLRHTQLTEIEKTFGSGITNIYGNWGRGSKMRERYVHLANSDQQRAILSRYGLLKGEEETLLKPKSCPRCSEQCSPDKKRCSRCGFILDHKLAMTYARKEQNATKSLEKRVNRIERALKENTDTIKEIADHIKLRARVPT